MIYTKYSINLMLIIFNILHFLMIKLISSGTMTVWVRLSIKVLLPVIPVNRLNKPVLPRLPTLFSFLFLMIAYIALFSTLLSRLTAFACGSTWVTSFIARFLNIHRSGILTALAWLVRHENCSHLGASSVYTINHAPCHFIQLLCLRHTDIHAGRSLPWPGLNPFIP